VIGFLLVPFKKKNRANTCTGLRTGTFLLGFFFFVCSTQTKNAWTLTISLTIMILSLLGDALDGKIARSRWGEVTRLGKILDPLVDKVIWLVYWWSIYHLLQRDQQVEFFWICGGVLLLTLLDMKSATGYLLKLCKGQSLQGANGWGKTKFWLVATGAMVLLMQLSPVIPFKVNPWFDFWIGIHWMASNLFAYLWLLVAGALVCSGKSLYKKKKGRNEEFIPQRVLEKN
jgi:phosphatidylglycerophosphate synthase